MPIMISREEIRILKEQEKEKKTPLGETTMNDKVFIIDKRIFLD